MTSHFSDLYSKECLDHAAWSLSKSKAAIKAAMANVLFLAKEDLPSSKIPAFNSFLLYQV